MKFKKKCQKKGIVILNALIAIVIVGLLGISLTSIYANMFSTLSAGRDASQAQQYAQIEGEYLKTQGYDNADSSVHDWKTMENLLGSDDGNLWESKVESVRDTETDDGNKLKIVKVSVRQKGDTTSRASYEVPLSSQDGELYEETSKYVAANSDQVYVTAETEEKQDDWSVSHRPTSDSPNYIWVVGARVSYPANGVIHANATELKYKDWVLAFKSDETASASERSSMVYSYDFYKVFRGYVPFQLDSNEQQEVINRINSRLNDIKREFSATTGMNAEQFTWHVSYR